MSAAVGLKIPAAKRALRGLLDSLESVEVVVRGAERALPDRRAVAYLYRTENIQPRSTPGNVTQSVFDLQVTFEASEKQPRRTGEDTADAEETLLDQIEARCWGMVGDLAEALRRSGRLSNTVSEAELAVTTEESGAVSGLTTCRIYCVVSCVAMAL